MSEKRSPSEVAKEVIKQNRGKAAVAAAITALAVGGGIAHESDKNPTENSREQGVETQIEMGGVLKVINGTLIEQLGDGETRLINNPIVEAKVPIDKLGDPLTSPTDFYFYSAEVDDDGEAQAHEIEFDPDTMQLLGSGQNKGGLVVWTGTLHPQEYTVGRDEDTYEMHVKLAEPNIYPSKGGVPLVAEEYFGHPGSK